MNTDNVAKHYNRLTPAERVSLILSAGVRGDEVERKRLVESAPKIRLEMSDYQPLGRAHDRAEKMHLLTVLDLTAKFWLFWGLWMSAAPAKRGKARNKKRGRSNAIDDETRREFRTYTLLRYHAYRLIVHIDAWTQFCADRNLDPLPTLQLWPGWDTVKLAEGKARDLAYSFRDACMFLAFDGLPDGEDLPDVIPEKAETVPGLIHEWQTILNYLLRMEGG